MGLGFFRGGKINKIKSAIDNIRKSTVADIMSKYMISIRKDETIVAAATKMVAEDVSCLLVMEGNKLEGILTERDFLRKVPLDKKVFKMKVKDIMTPNVVTVEPDLSLCDSVAIMKKNNFRRLVVASKGNVLGLVTQTDFSKKVSKEFSYFPALDNWDVFRISVPPLFITSKESFNTAKEKMRKADLAAIIINEKKGDNKNIKGIFSEYDVVMQFYDQQRELDVKEVASFTRKYVRAIEKGTNILEANKLLLENKIHRFPVIDGDKVVGVFTQREMIRFIYLKLEELEESLSNPKTPIIGFWSGKPDGEFRGENIKVYTTVCSRGEHRKG